MNAQLTTIQKALQGDSFWLHPQSEEAKTIERATKDGYIRRISHTQAELTEKAVKELTEPKILESLRTLAYRAHCGTSFSPERRAETVVNDYSAELKEDIKTITGQGANAEQVERYTNQYKIKLSSYLSSQSNVMSTMITGPANFPTARNEKKRRAADSHYSNFREWRTKVLNAYVRYQKKQINESQGGELGAARLKLASLEANRELEKEANKKIREAKKTGANIDEYLFSLGTQPHMIEHIMRWGFGSCNTNANIRNAKKRVEELEKKEAQKNEGSKELKYDGFVIIQNTEIDRVQIKHDTKPTQEVINLLKSNGFKWSPSQGVWQRQLTNNTIWALKHYILPELTKTN